MYLSLECLVDRVRTDYVYYSTMHICISTVYSYNNSSTMSIYSTYILFNYSTTDLLIYYSINYTIQLIIILCLLCILCTRLLIHATPL